MANRYLRSQPLKRALVNGVYNKQRKLSPWRIMKLEKTVITEMAKTFLTSLELNAQLRLTKASPGTCPE